MMKEVYLVIPYYKNKPLVSQIRMLSSKDSVCGYLLIAKDESLKAIHTLIENNESLSHRQKSYDYVTIDDNFHIYVLYLSEKQNRLYEPERKKNGSFGLKNLKIGLTSSIPEHKLFEYKEPNDNE